MVKLTSLKKAAAVLLTSVTLMSAAAAPRQRTFPRCARLWRPPVRMPSA